ncbi:MAG: hypothetical protein QNJ81_02175 [Acidimicrobiia bacterium]|nr:hypothetical protein [Acidimicrobiia bacterium]
MAATVWIVRREVNEKNDNIIDGITSCIINRDNLADNEASVLAAATAAARAAGIPLPDGYFSTAAQWNDAGEIDASDDALFLGQGRVEAIS